MMVHYLSIENQSIDIVQVVLESTCLLEISDLVISAVWLIVVATGLPEGLLGFFPLDTLVPICILLFLYLSICIETNVR